MWSTKQASCVFRSMAAVISWDVIWASDARDTCLCSTTSWLWLCGWVEGQSYWVFRKLLWLLDILWPPTFPDSLMPQCRKLRPRQTWHVELPSRPKCLFSHSFCILVRLQILIPPFSHRLLFRVLTTASMLCISIMCWNFVYNLCQDWILRTSYNT